MSNLRVKNLEILPHRRLGSINIFCDYERIIFERIIFRSITSIIIIIFFSFIFIPVEEGGGLACRHAVDAGAAGGHDEWDRAERVDEPERMARRERERERERAERRRDLEIQ